MAADDELFAVSFNKPQKNIDDCITYILNAVKKSGVNGYNDDEVYAMAAHYYDEDDIDVGNPVQCRVVVNHTPELTPEEIEQAKKQALDKVMEDERKRVSSHKPKTVAKETQVEQPSLF